MAEIPKLESGRVGLTNIPGAVTPNITFRAAQPEIALEAQSKMQGTISQKLDRISGLIFREGTEISKEAGLQWAAENPLTRDQLDAMTKGDMSKVSLGSPMNVFDTAVRKVRAFELSAHAEAETTTKMLDLYNRAERGELDFDGVRTGIKTLTDGFGQSLAQVDPESSFKYRASISNYGNRIIDETAKLENKKRMITNGIKLQKSYNDTIKIIELYTSGDMPIDPATGEKFNKDEVVGMIATNFLNNAVAMIGVNGAAEYQKQIMKDIGLVKMNVISKGIIDKDPDLGGDLFGAVEKLRTGMGGKYQEIYNSMTLEEQAGLRTKMRGQYNEITASKKDDQERNKVMDEDEARFLIADYLKKPNKATLDKLQAIAIRSGAVSPEYVADLPNKALNAEPRNLVAEMTLKDEINNGVVNDLASLQRRAKQLGIGVRRTAELQDSVYSADRKIDTEIDKIARQQAKLVRGQLNISATQADEYYKFIDAVNERYRVDTESWTSGGKKGAAPNKVDIANQLVNKRRDSTVTRTIDTIEDNLTKDYGPNGTQKKSNHDFPNLRLRYSGDGVVIGLHEDVIAALKRDGFTDAQIDDVFQRLKALDNKKKERANIK